MGRGKNVILASDKILKKKQSEGIKIECNGTHLSGLCGYFLKGGSGRRFIGGDLSSRLHQV